MHMQRDVLERLRLAIEDVEIVDLRGTAGVAERQFRPRRDRQLPPR